MTYKLPNPIEVENGGTGVQSLVAYTPLLGGTTSTGDVQSVASLGNAGDVLVSGGAGVVPSFQPAISAGALVQIGSTQTASASATISFTSGINTTYDTYLIVVSNAVPTVAAGLVMTFSVNGGSSYLATGYQSGLITQLYNLNTNFNDNSTTFVNISGGQVTTASKGASAFIWLYGLATSNLPKCFIYSYWDNAAPLQLRGCANNSTTTGVNAIRFAYTATTIASGSFTLFGLTK